MFDVYVSKLSPILQYRGSQTQTKFQNENMPRTDVLRYRITRITRKENTINQLTVTFVINNRQRQKLNGANDK